MPEKKCKVYRIYEKSRKNRGITGPSLGIISDARSPREALEMFCQQNWWPREAVDGFVAWQEYGHGEKE